MQENDTSVNMSQYHVHTQLTLLKRTSEFIHPNSLPQFSPFYVSNTLMAGTSPDAGITPLVAGCLLFTKVSQSDSALGSHSTDLFPVPLMFLATQAAAEQPGKEPPPNPQEKGFDWSWAR